MLAQSQKAAYEYSGLDRVIYVASNFSQMGKIDPIWSRATQWLKPDVIFRRAIEATSAPMEIMRTREEYDKFIAGIDEKEEALAAQAAAAQQSQAVLQNAQNLNTRVAPGSMLGKH